MEKVRYMISDAATMAGVESHVLRYWEDELDLTIPRNEMGHRYYTRENIQEFQRIKELKEQGYQLKAIRMILHNGGEVPPPQPVTTVAGNPPTPAIQEQMPAKTPPKPVPAAPVVQPVNSAITTQQSTQPAPGLSPEERMVQFRELMSDIVGHAIAQNNEELSLNIGEEVKESVLKEMNYLFREQEEAQEERYKKLDAAIRGNLKKKRTLFEKSDKPAKEKPKKAEKAERTAEKRKAKASLT